MVFSVVRPRCAFRVVLDRDDRKRAMAHAFDAAVVEIDMRYFDFGRQAIGLHREAVIV